MPLDKSVKKVLMIGSGPIIIGQAAEFDYAGAQACTILRKQGIETVLVNSNPATIMTDTSMADAIYLEPLNLDTLKRIIVKEKPDSLLAGLGGQTALTLAMQLNENNWLQRHGVRLLGTDINAILDAEDRDRFRSLMHRIGQPCVPSEIANSMEEVMTAANHIGYPVIVRPAFTLGGTGGGIASDSEELHRIARNGLDMSPIHQVLIEKCISGWKEIEFETMRDANGNVLAICSMENVDPVGIHTGDSIVVAPALTLADKELQMLRTAALDIICAIGIVGGCNVQFALHPDSFEYAVIEVNPRVSRSSALASKATGYPIAKVTTMIALGYSLDEIKNEVTGKTTCFFEPALDYVAVKFPKWPFEKFFGSDRKLGTQMKATGEVMAIAPTFEAGLMKAIRGAEIGLDTLNAAPLDNRDVRERLHDQNDRRIFTIFEAIKKGVSLSEIHDITKIDLWFLAKIANLARYEETISHSFGEEEYIKGKNLGYTDEALKRLSGRKEIPHMDASFKMVDTCAAEFDAATPYFYSVYDKHCDARRFERSGKPVVIVIGSGPIRIGQGIEFDYSCVHCVWTLRQKGYDVVIINNNPETVSTDYDTADRLYFEPLMPEDVMNIIAVEKPIGVVVAFGGQTAIRLTNFLHSQGIRILGTTADAIDLAEDRARFDALLEEFGIRRPKGLTAMNLAEAKHCAETLGFPVLLRPSYVIGGQNMTIAHEMQDVIGYMERIMASGIENPVLIDQYLPGIELEVDVISDGVDVLIPGIMEHIERAGVHSGDSIAVYPPYNLNDMQMETVCEVSTKLALAMKTQGLVNIQYLLYKGELYVIEVNPRASRTVPYISKVTGIQMTDIASRVMTGETLASIGCGTGLYPIPPYTCIKVPVFSFEKLQDANVILGPEMKSTGEVLGIGRTFSESLCKGLMAAGFTVPRPTGDKRLGVLISVDSHDYQEILGVAKQLHSFGMKLYATTGTADTIASLGLDVTKVANVTESDEIYRLMESGALSYIIYTGALLDETLGDFRKLHRKAMNLSIPCLTSADTAEALAEMITSGYNALNTELVNIANMRKSHVRYRFTKMQDCGNDYIFIENFDGKVEAIESLCVTLCDRHTGIGADGIVLLEKSDKADALMRTYNKDGSFGHMAGNNLRCVAKYLYDNGYVNRNTITIEADGSLITMRVYLRNGKVSYVSACMGKASFESQNVPVLSSKSEVIDQPVEIAGQTWNITCLSVGNPHCVVFTDSPDGIDLEIIGPLFENNEMFPVKTNTEFVRIVDSRTIRARVWERGNGATLACGTGACAAALAAIKNGYCQENTDITVKLDGGDMTVRVEDNGNVFLSGGASIVFEGSFDF